jgi:hypothetical protein
MLEKWHDRLKIPAIHDHDLETVLNDLGILDKVTSGEVLCSVCGAPLTLDTIECLYMQGTELKLCCQKVECCELAINTTESKEVE